MDYKSEVAIECVEYRRYEDGSGGTAVIEVPTIPCGLLLRISGVRLVRMPPAGAGPDGIVPLWRVHFPDETILEHWTRNKFRTAVMAAVVRYEKAVEAEKCPSCKLKLRPAFSTIESRCPRHLTTVIQ